jgi:GntR family transcriptional regulator/MocR family aminotransferase
MDIILDGMGPTHQQLVRAIKAGIAGGRFIAGSRLPPSRDLARDLQISRTTVLTAYQRLQSEGLLVGKVGDGSYVATPQRPLRARPAAQWAGSAPQSAYSRRARAQFVAEEALGQSPPAARYAFLFNLPLVNTALPALWAKAVARAAAYLPSGYPPIAGLPALREALARHIMQARGVACGADDILIVSGAQQAFDLIARTLIDEADEVVMEEPSYDRVRKLLRIHGARITAVPVDAEGMRTDLVLPSPCKLIYVTPSHQFPTGAVMSQARRHALLDLARASGSWICEDDFDGEFRQEGRPVPSLQSLDPDGRVIYVGSFSRTLFPALRLGYVVMPPALREDLIAAKWAQDLGTPALEQAAMAQLITSGAYERHLRSSTAILAKRREALKRALREACGAKLRISASHCGMHLLVWIDAIDAQEANDFVRLAASRRIGLHSVNRFYVGGRPPALGLLMGYSAMPQREIATAVAAFAAFLDDYLAARSTAASEGARNGR